MAFPHNIFGVSMEYNWKNHLFITTTGNSNDRVGNGKLTSLNSRLIFVVLFHSSSYA